MRVLAVGASETFGLYESQDHDYPRQLEDSLQHHADAACAPPSSTPTVEVVNAALPGMALPSMDRYLDDVVRRVGPAVVVLYPSPGFYLNTRAPKLTRGWPGADSTLPLGNALVLRSDDRVVAQLKRLAPEPVMRWARRTMTERKARFSSGPRFLEVPADRMAQFEQELRAVVGTARSLGAHVVLMGHVNATMAPGFNDPALEEAWVYQFPTASAKALSDFHAMARALERRVAADSSITYVDLPDAFAGRWEGAFADFVHFTDGGAAVVAGALTRAIAPTVLCGPEQAP
ncbi:MAG: SGNH/GDSL hydrolase family protein [Gemmatimonadaceae bacterium]